MSDAATSSTGGNSGDATAEWLEAAAAVGQRNADGWHAVRGAGGACSEKQGTAPSAAQTNGEVT